MNSQPKTQAELLSAYLCTAHNLRPNTRQIKHFAFKLLKERIGDIPVAQVTSELANEFVNSLIMREYKPNTIRIWITAMQPIWDFAEHQGWVAHNPFTGMKLPKAPSNEVIVFTPQQIATILTACPNERWQFMVSLALSGALRIGEVLALRRVDMDLENGRIIIQPHEETATEWRWDIKDYERREVPLQDKAADLYTFRILPSLRQDQPYVCLTYKRYKGLLAKKKNYAMGERDRSNPQASYARTFKKLLRRHGIREGSFHALRATCITSWLEQGIPIEEVRYLAGHADISTTHKYYYHLNRKRVVERARRISTF